MTAQNRPSRRNFLIKAGAAGLAGTGVAGLAGATNALGQLAGVRSATPRDLQNLIGDGRRRRILLRGAFCLQRALANDLAFQESNPGNLPVPQLLTCRQCIEMVTIAGAAANRLLDKVGTLTPGKEADIVVLDARNINTWPMNNVPGTIVTMMNPRHVRDVLIAERVVYWKGKLVGWNVDRLLRQLEQARDRVLARINGPAKVAKIPPGNNSFSNPCRPNFLGSCCYKGQNITAPEYVLRP